MLVISNECSSSSAVVGSKVKIKTTMRGCTTYASDQNWVILEGGTYLTSISNLKNTLPLISGNQHPISISKLLSIMNQSQISKIKFVYSQISKIKFVLHKISKIKISLIFTNSNFKNRMCPISHLKIRMYIPHFIVCVISMVQCHLGQRLGHDNFHISDH